MKNEKRIIVVFIIMVMIISIFPRIVNADMGEKPSITIKIKNLETNNYIIDLLTYAKDEKDYYPDSNFSNNERTSSIDKPGEIDKNGITVYFDQIAESRNITLDQAKQLYNIDYNGWISANTRDSLLWGTCNGNKEHEHYYNYFGVPDRYKIIIINNDTGKIKVSNEIIRKDLSSEVVIDYDSMNIESSSSLNIKNIILILLITITIELMIALFMNYRKYIKVIVIANIITNVLLQFLLIIISGNYFIKLALFEILVIIAEYLIYKKFMKDERTSKILIYTMIANIITACMTFIIK